MIRKTYDENGFFDRGDTVIVETTNRLSHDFKFFNRTVKGFPNNWRRQMLKEANGKYPVMCPLLLYNISVA